MPERGQRTVKMSPQNKANSRDRSIRIFAVMLFVVVGLITYRSLFMPGHVIFGDFTVISSMQEALHSSSMWAWNDRGSTSNISQLSKIVLYAPLYLLAPNMSFTRSITLYLLLFSVVSGYSMFRLTSLILKPEATNAISRNVFSLCAALVYTLSPFITTEASHPSIKIAYYLSPLISLVFLKALLQQERRRWIVISAVIWSMAVAAMHWLLFGLIIVVLTAIGWLISTTGYNREHCKTSLFQAGKGIALLVGLFFLFNAYWIVPGMLSGGTSLYGNILTEEGVSTIFRNANILNTLALKGGFSDQRYWNQGALTTVSTIALLVLVITAMSCLLWRRNVLKQLFLGCFALFAVFLGSGPRLAPQLYYWLQFQAPSHSMWSWALRTPKSNFLVSFSVSLLLAASGMALEKAVARHSPRIAKVRRWAFVLVVAGLIGVGNYPVTTGTFSGNLRPVELPTEFSEAVNWVKEHAENPKDGRVIWGPPYAGWPANWHSSPIGNLTGGITPQPTFSSSTFTEMLTWPLLFGRAPYLDSLVYQAEVNTLSKFLSPLSISAILVHNDILNHTEEITRIADNLRKTDLSFAWNEGFINVFTLENYAALISCRNILVSISGGLRSYNSLTNLDSFQPYTQQAVVYVDQIFNDYRVDRASIFITNLGGVADFILQGADEKLVLAPFDYTNHYSPADAWSKERITGLGFRGQLARLEILNQYQFGFSRGVVFTWGVVSLPGGVEPSDEDLIVDWDFETQASRDPWKEDQRSGIQEVKWEDGYLVNELLVSTWGWKGVKAPPIPATYGEVYRFNIRLQADNISQLHVKIEELDSLQGSLGGKQLAGLGSGSFDWKEVVLSYAPMYAECCYLRLVIWHGHETPQPLPNILSIDYIKVYNMAKYSCLVSLDVPFTVNREDRYDLFVRCLESEKGGAIRLYLDGRPVLVTTEGELNRFIWKDLGVWNLTAGKQTITIENVQGFNAMNVLVLLPSSEYSLAEEKFKDLLNSRHIVYGLEAETDLRSSNEEYDVASWPVASNGRVLRFDEQQEAWQQLDIIKEGDYRLAVAGQGVFKVAIDDHIETISMDALQIMDLLPRHLEAGKHQLQITSLADGSFLDIIWVYSAKATETLEDILTIHEEAPEIIRYERVDPTKYETLVEAQKPFMLSFAEAYDPLWVAEVRTPEGVERYSPAPLYGVINGFWIDETGKYTIAIRYKPQRWFYYGACISILSLLGAIGWLFWSWRKERVRAKR